MSKILVVDDSKDIAFLIGDLFSNLKHDVTICFNGNEAIDHIKNDQFDLIITDIIMPERDGLDVIKFVKNENVKTPIVAITGGGIALSADSAIQALKHDVDAFLKKPVMRNELLAVTEPYLK